jgi:hypothetical protein
MLREQLLVDNCIRQSDKLLLEDGIVALLPHVLEHDVDADVLDP